MVITRGISTSYSHYGDMYKQIQTRGQIESSRTRYICGWGWRGPAHPGVWHDEEWDSAERDPLRCGKCSCSKAFRPGYVVDHHSQAPQHFNRHSKASIPNVFARFHPHGTWNNSSGTRPSSGRAPRLKQPSCRRPSVPRDARPRRTLWRGPCSVLHRREGTERGRRTVGSGPNRALWKDFQGPETTGLRVRGAPRIDVHVDSVHWHRQRPFAPVLS